MCYTNDDLSKILKKDFFEDPKAFHAGRRNDDAVDFSIICHCLGVDPREEFDKLCVEHDFKKVDYDLAVDHMERVEPYLDRWGEEGTMDAMVYCINY